MAKQHREEMKDFGDRNIDEQSGASLLNPNGCIKNEVQRKSRKLKEVLTTQGIDFNFVIKYVDLVERADENFNENSLPADTRIQRKQGKRTNFTETVETSMWDVKDLNNDMTVYDEKHKKEKKIMKQKEKLAGADVNGFEGKTVLNEMSTKKNKKRRNDSEDFQCEQEVEIRQQSDKLCRNEDNNWESSLDDASIKKVGKSKSRKAKEFSFKEEVTVKKDYKTSSGPSYEDQQEINFDAVSTKKESKRRKKESENFSSIGELFIKQEDGGTHRSHSFKEEDVKENYLDISIKKEKKKKKTHIEKAQSHFMEESLVDHQDKGFTLKCENTEDIKIKKRKTEVSRDEAYGQVEAEFTDISQPKKKRKHSKNGSDDRTDVSVEAPSKKQRKLQSEKKVKIDDADECGIAKTSNDIPQKNVRKNKTKRGTSKEASNAEKSEKVKSEDDQPKQDLEENVKKHKRRGRKSRKSDNACEVNGNDVSGDSSSVNANVIKPSVTVNNSSSKEMHSHRNGKRKLESRKRKFLENDFVEHNFTSDSSQITFKFKNHPVVKDYVPRKLLRLNGISPQLNVDKVDLKIPEIHFNGSSLNEIEGYGAD